jgi:protocatechuate 3,4-dioxygenase beta subunit
MGARFTRRSILEGTAAVMAGRAATANALPLTPRNELGPFYRRNAPNETVLWHPADPGLPLEVHGRVLDGDGKLLSGASVEIWQADHAGHYDVDGNRYRAKLTTGPDGTYRVTTVMPGHYPGRVCQHIHFLVKAEGHTALVTQLYFASDPVFDGDPAANFSRDPLLGDPALIRPVTLRETVRSTIAQCSFDLVLGRA